MRSFWQGIRYTFRVLGRNPGFTAVAVLSLALGIGANTAIFTLVNALLLRELPVREPERLVQLSVVRQGDNIPLSYPMFREVARGQRVFSGLMGWTFGNMSNVEVNGVTSQAAVSSVTGNYYSELGVPPLLGRLIAPDDANASSGTVSPVAVLGYEFWQRRFGGAANVVGRQIRIEGQALTIIGVTRKWFTGMTTGRPPEVTVPMKATDDRSLLWVSATGRLKNGITLAQARAQLESFWPEVLLATASTETPGLRRQMFLSMRLDAAPVATGVARDLRAQYTRPLYVLLGIVGLILVVACVNLANLMLARAAAHSYEVSVRVALGASRWALARQVFTESLVLSVSGALVGLAFGYWGSGLLATLMTQGSLAPITLDLRPDWRVLLATAAMAILTGILFGGVPALRGSREDPAAVLRQTARSLGGATGKAGKALMVTQVALSLVLLFGAGLLVRSFQKLCTVDTGFEGRVLVASLYPRPGGYQNLDLNAYRRQLLDRVASVPGVLSVGFANFAGPGQKSSQYTVSKMADAAVLNAGVMTTELMVSPGFLRTLGIRLALGRDFEWTDDEHHPHVAILSSNLAARLFPEGNAIGQRVRFGFMPELQNLEVVGIASTARLFDLRDTVATVIYLPSMQHGRWAQTGNLFLRTQKSADAAARSVGREAESLGHEYLLGAETIEQAMSQALTADRVVALLSGFFAVLALLLASIGLYGLTSYTVARRTREFGIRTALGAQPGAVRWGVLREALALALGGIVMGIPCALGAGRLIANMLFGTSADDLATICLVSLLLLAVALLASYVPARRASRIDPTVALRAE
jgi:predicted permease